MLMLEKDINWNDLEIKYKRGTYIKRIVTSKPFTKEEEYFYISGFKNGRVDYKQKIVNEWWIYDQQALKENTADEMATIICSPDLIKETYVQMVSTFFGQKTLTWSSCPLLRNPLKVE
jgi:hypothetical protein